MTKKRLAEFLKVMTQKRKALVNPEWEEMLVEYEQLRKGKLLRRKKADNDWYEYIITTKGEQLYQKLKNKASK
jgi:predicted transcriptional regulator